MRGSFVLDLFVSLPEGFSLKELLLVLVDDEHAVRKERNAIAKNA